MKFFPKIILLLYLFSFTSCEFLDELESSTENPPEPLPNKTFEQEGIASYYADKFEGRTTASGEIFRQDSLTAAHKHLPFGTIVLVTNLKNNQQVTVKINDRGPFVSGRIIDLSKRGAQTINMINDGIVDVKIEAVIPENIADSLYQIINKP